MKRFISIAIFAVASAFIICLATHARSGTNTVYDPDSNHLWNRLNDTLFARRASAGPEYGLDEPDILYWVHTDHLLTEPSNRQALAVLDEFINAHGDQLISNPLKRALLQHDLWELFDWSLPAWNHVNERKELQERLAIAIRWLALTTNEIASLSDNYLDAERNFSLPDLPHGLFDTNGDWVNLAPQKWGSEEIAPAHDHAFGGCSLFLVFMRTPEGRAATTNYLYQLDTFERAWVYETNQFPGPNFPPAPSSPWCAACVSLIPMAASCLRPSSSASKNAITSPSPGQPSKWKTTGASKPCRRIFLNSGCNAPITLPCGP